MKQEIELRGVGGQGAILAAHTIGEASLRGDLHAVIGEIHGMSQRGGSVLCTVRIGDVYGPMIERIDTLIAMEGMEALRSYGKLDEGSAVILNNRIIPTFMMSQGRERIFTIGEVVETLRKKTARIALLDATGLAEKAGSVLTENVVMLGAVSKFSPLPFDEEMLRLAIEASVPRRYIEENLRAFELGKSAV